MVRDLQCCPRCGDRVGENRVWMFGRWETELSEDFACGCGEHFCSIDCLIDHGEEAHTNGYITSWPEGTDSRLFESGEIERRWRERQAIAPEHSESGSDSDSSDSSSDSDSDTSSECSTDCESVYSDCEEDITCSCGNYVGTLCNGEFLQMGAIPSECDQDGVRWCSDCWARHDNAEEEQQQEEVTQQEGEIEQTVRCECCSKELGLTGFTNNKGSFCSDSCLQLWSGCPNICSEEKKGVLIPPLPCSNVARTLDFDEVAGAVAENCEN